MMEEVKEVEAVKAVKAVKAAITEARAAGANAMRPGEMAHEMELQGARAAVSVGVPVDSRCPEDEAAIGAHRNAHCAHRRSRRLGL